MLFKSLLCLKDGEGNGTPLQYSCLENPMDGGAWKAPVHGLEKSPTRLRAFTFTFHFHGLEKEMATHSNVLAWRIPGMGEPGGLPSMGSHRVQHDWSDLAASSSSILKRNTESIPSKVQKKNNYVLLLLFNIFFEVLNNKNREKKWSYKNLNIFPT